MSDKSPPLRFDGLVRKLKSGVGWLWAVEDDFGWRDIVVPSAVSWMLVAVTVVIGTLDVLLPAQHELGPLTRALGNSTAEIASGQWWRLATWALVNPPIESQPDFFSSATGHLVGNMVGLVLVGPRLERAIGHVRFLVLYVMATVVANAVVMNVIPLGWRGGGGSSASVYGLQGAILVVAFLSRRRSARERQYFAVALIAIVVLSGLITSNLATARHDQFTNITHGVGFIVGAALALAWLRYDNSFTVALIVPALVVFSAGLVVARSAQARETDPRVRRIPIDSGAELVTHAFGSIWAHGDGVVTRLDASTGRIVARIRIGANPQPAEGFGGAMVAAAGSLWVAGDRSVVEVDPLSNKVESRVPVPGPGPWGLAASDDVLWAALNTEDKVARFDLHSRRVSVTRVGDTPYTVLANEKGAWVANYRSRSVSRLDPRTGRVIVTARLEGEPYWMELRRFLWVGIPSALIRLDPESLRVLDRLELPDYVYAFALDPKGEIWVSNRFNFSIRRVAPGSGEVLERMRIGLGQPAGMTIGNDLWVADPWRRSVLRVETSS